METDQIQVERRAGYRFSCHVPVAIRLPNAASELAGCTENLSMRGAYIFTETPLSTGATVEMTLTLPSEITLGEEMRVRCQACVLRATPANEKSKPGAAVHFESYEYLAAAESVTTTAAFDRLFPLHEHANT